MTLLCVLKCDLIIELLFLFIKFRNNIKKQHVLIGTVNLFYEKVI